jgi:hypothetical protein
MLTNVQQDVHNNNIIQLGTFRNAFHKATLWDCYCGANFENARKLSIKIPSNAIFGGKPKGP